MSAAIEFKQVGITAENIDAVLSERCTEKAAAAEFCKMFGAYVRWVPEAGWHVWDNYRWKPDDLLVRQMALEIGQQFRLMAATYKDLKIAAGFFRWAKVCESARGIAAFLELAKPALAAPISEFDAGPWLLNFRNCRMDLSKPYDCSKHRSGDLSTKMIPHDYAVDARRCAWGAFLERILPDPDVRAYIQRAAGYSLTGSTREQCFFLCYGAGCNGKSTFLDVILSVFGSDYAAQADPRTFMLTGQEGIRNDLARLRGIRFLATVETGEGKRLDEGLVKSLTGGDAICARFLHHEFFEFRPEFKLWLATNHRPVIRDTSHAMWRRVRLIPFEVTIPEPERDRDIKDKLLAEAEGILSWAIDGAAAYMEGGLQDPESVLAATADYRNREDLLGEFLAACTRCWEFGQVGATDLYKMFLDYTGAKISQTAFGRLMEERISSDGLMGVTRGVKDGRKIFKGIGLCATV
jgi:putative DNA primase/helicase